MQIDNQKLIKRARELVFLIALRKQSFVRAFAIIVAKSQKIKTRETIKTKT